MYNHLEKMRSVGLTEYEAKAYYTLLQKGNFTAIELSKAADIPRTRIYEVLNNLVNKGLCKQIHGNMKSFKANNPAYAFDRLLDDLQQEHKFKIKKVNELSHLLMPIYNTNKENHDPLEFIEVIKEQSSIINKTNELERKAKREILAMNKAPYAVDLATVVRKRSIKRKNGIKYKFLSEVSYPIDDDLLEFLSLWEDAGAEIRVLEKVPIKMMIFDQQKVILSLQNKISASKSGFTSMVINHTEMAQFLTASFESYYANALSLEQFKHTL